MLAIKKILTVGLAVWMLAWRVPAGAQTAPADASAPFRFELAPLPFHLEDDETVGRNAPEAMGGGVAVFDYNNDGRPDIFFANGANIATLKKDDPKYRNRLFRNDGNGHYTDVTEQAGVAGTGYDIGVAVADYDNDGRPDLFVAGVHKNTLYHNNGNGTFTDVTAKAGLGSSKDPEFGPLWSITGAWVDANNDGLLDLFVVNYMQWSFTDKPLCAFKGVGDYCHPKFYKPQPNQLFLNKGDGTFQDVSASWGLRQHPGKGMGAGVADYDQDGKPDIFVTNDASYNSLFHNTGSKFEEVAFETGVALPEDGSFVSGMGLDFRDFNNDGWPDIAYVALNNQTFPLLENTGKGDFREVTAASGMREATMKMAGYCAAFYDLDNDGWKDLFVTRGHVEAMPIPGAEIDQYNTVFRNPGRAGKWKAYTEGAGLGAGPSGRHRGCAFADLDGDGRVDVVTTGLNLDAEIWMNRSPRSGHWLDVKLRGVVSNRDGIGARVKVVAKSGPQFNHMTTSVGYASSSDGPVHFGMGEDTHAEIIEIRWPSGKLQTMHDVAVDQVVQVTEKAD